MREQKSDTTENQEITELAYPEPEDSELLVDPVSLRVTPFSSIGAKMYVKLVRQ